MPDVNDALRTQRRFSEAFFIQLSKLSQLLLSHAAVGKDCADITAGYGDRLFCRVLRKVYYIPYGDVRRYFRRVQEVNVKMCCCGGELAIENLVICGENDTELLQVQLPGTKAAKILIDELKEKMPNAVYGKPVAAE